MINVDYYDEKGEDHILSTTLNFIPPVGTTTFLKKTDLNDELVDLGSFTVSEVHHSVHEIREKLTKFHTRERVEIYLKKI